MITPRPDPPKGTILIVDDALDNLTLLYTGLMERGYKVRKAVNGKTALMGAEAVCPDLILLDIRMPDMDGYEVCQRLKASERTCHIPIIFLSALDDVFDKVTGFELGGVDYITKPFQMEEVVARINTQLALEAAKAEVLTLNAELEQRVQQRTEELQRANAELQEREVRLRQHSEQQALMAAIAQHIRQSLDLTTILNTTVEEVRQFLQVDRVVIYQFAPDWNGTVVVESVVHPRLSLLGRVIADACFAKKGYVERYTAGQGQNLDDITTANLTNCYGELLSALQIQANLVVPIVYESTLWGLLAAHHCTEPRQWQPLEVEMMRQLGTQVAIAIHQSKLFQTVQQLNTSLEHQVQERTSDLQKALNFEALLKRITDKVRDSLDETQILQTAVEALAMGLGVECCDAALYDLERGVSKIVYEHNRSLPPAAGKEFPFTETASPAIYEHLFQRQPCHACLYQPNPVRPNGIPYAVLACPMFVQDAALAEDPQTLFGDLWLFKPANDSFSELEIRLVQQVANQCAIALRQARLYAASQAQVEALERLNLLKDDFLSTVSHELRTPVTNMKMAIQMLHYAFKQMQAAGLNQVQATSPLGKLVDRATQYIHILDNECLREISLINDLLDLQRLESGSQQLVPERIDLNLWLLQQVETFRERTRSRQQQLDFQIANALPSIVSDPTSLSRIVTELLQNACKYTPPGERIVVSAGLNQDQIQICVANFGVEIPPKEIPHLFEKFYRVPSSDRWQQGGTGLGLALVQQLTEHLHGKIHVHSSQNQTRFVLEIPQACAQKGTI